MTIADTPARSHEAGVLAAHAEAAFRWRVLALILDLIILSLIYGVVNLVFGVEQVTNVMVNAATGAFSGWTGTYGVDAAWLPIIAIAYFFGLEALFGATIGKWRFRLLVTDLRGRRPSLWAILARNLLRLIDSLPTLYLVGGVAALTSPLRQRLGDRLAHTLVVPRESLAEPPLTRTQIRRRLTLVGAVVATLLVFCAGFFYYGRPPLVVQSAVNTRQMLFADGVRSYTLGAPQWGEGTVTYAVRYETQVHPRACSGTITLRFEGFPAGWQSASAVSSCA